MAAQFLFDRKPANSLAALISGFSDSALDSPFKSTVPLLALAKDDWTAFAKVLTLCNVIGDLSVAFDDRNATLFLEDNCNPSSGLGLLT